MKLYCDYCGSQIDTDKDITCPHCGAAYAQDAELKAELKREENRLLLNDLDKKIRAHQEEEIWKEMERHRKEEKLIRVGRIIVAVISLVLVIYVMIKVGTMLPH